MSGEQRDNNLGIDSELRNRDPAAYAEALRRKLKELDQAWGIKDSNSNDHADPAREGQRGETDGHN